VMALPPPPVLHVVEAKQPPDIEGDEVEFPTGELPLPPVAAQPIAAGLDQEF
jgi:hypothetical protein